MVCHSLSVSPRYSGPKLMCRSHSDYINPIDLCNRLNTYIVPEAAVHAFLTFLFLINGYWLAIILNLPLVAYNAKKYVFTYSEKRNSVHGLALTHLNLQDL